MASYGLYEIKSFFWELFGFCQPVVPKEKLPIQQYAKIVRKIEPNLILDQIPFSIKVIFSGLYTPFRGKRHDD